MKTSDELQLQLNALNAARYDVRQRLDDARWEELKETWETERVMHERIIARTAKEQIAKKKFQWDGTKWVRITADKRVRECSVLPKTGDTIILKNGERRTIQYVECGMALYTPNRIPIVLTVLHHRPRRPWTEWYADASWETVFVAPKPKRPKTAKRLKRARRKKS
jgi:hypothetical protein